MKQIDAGQLNQPIEIFEVAKIGEDVWRLSKLRKTWGFLKKPSTPNFHMNAVRTYGKFGLVVEFCIRKQRLPSFSIWKWDGKYLYPISVQPFDRSFLVVQACVVSVEDCYAAVGDDDPEETPDLSLAFPAIVLEKYLRYNREDTYDTNTLDLVLLTPKDIVFPAGAVLEILTGSAKGEYHTTLAHTLYPDKNEYELRKVGSL